MLLAMREVMLESMREVMLEVKHPRYSVSSNVPWVGSGDGVECEHDWQLVGLSLSLARGGTMTEVCARCSATRTTPDPVRSDRRRQRLPPTRRLRGE